MILITTSQSPTRHCYSSWWNQIGVVPELSSCGFMVQSSNILHSPRNAIPYRLPAALTSTMLTLYPWDTKNDHLYAASDLSAPSYPEFEFLSPSLLAKMYSTAFVLSALPL